MNRLAGIAPTGVDLARVRATFVEGLYMAARRLKAAGIKLLIEPISTHDIPCFFLNHTKHALEIMAELSSDNSFSSTTSTACKSWRATSPPLSSVTFR